MSGSLPTLGLHGDSRSKRNSGSTDYEPWADPSIKIGKGAELWAKRNPLVPPAAPDLADFALRDATSGKVRRVRAGSTRDSILGQAMQSGFLVLLSVATWLGLRGL